MNVTVTLDIVRGGRSTPVRREVVPGTRIRDLLREIGQAPEGCAALVGDRPVPLDLPIEGPMLLTIVPTFSGG